MHFGLGFHMHVARCFGVPSRIHGTCLKKGDAFFMCSWNPASHDHPSLVCGVTFYVEVWSSALAPHVCTQLKFTCFKDKTTNLKFIADSTTGLIRQHLPQAANRGNNGRKVKIWCARITGQLHTRVRLFMSRISFVSPCGFYWT